MEMSKNCLPFYQYICAKLPEFSTPSEDKKYYTCCAKILSYETFGNNEHNRRRDKWEILSQYAKGNSVYEILQPNKPRRIYFDIDNYNWGGDDFETEKIINLAKSFIEFYKLDKAVFQITSNQLSRHKSGRFGTSYHVIFNYYVENPDILRHVIDEFVQHNKFGRSVIDPICYNDTQPFRLPYSINGCLSLHYKNDKIQDGIPLNNIVVDFIEKYGKNKGASKYDFHSIVYGPADIQFIQDITGCHELKYKCKNKELKYIKSIPFYLRKANMPKQDGENSSSVPSSIPNTASSIPKDVVESSYPKEATDGEVIEEKKDSIITRITKVFTKIPIISRSNNK